MSWSHPGIVETATAFAGVSRVSIRPELCTQQNPPFPLMPSTEPAGRSWAMESRTAKRKAWKANPSRQRDSVADSRRCRPEDDQMRG